MWGSPLDTPTGGSWYSTGLKGERNVTAGYFLLTAWVVCMPLSTMYSWQHPTRSAFWISLGAAFPLFSGFMALALDASKLGLLLSLRSFARLGLVLLATRRQGRGERAPGGRPRKAWKCCSTERAKSVGEVSVFSAGGGRVWNYEVVGGLAIVLCLAWGLGESGSQSDGRFSQSEAR